MLRFGLVLSFVLALPLAASVQAACEADDCSLPDDEQVQALARGVGRVDFLNRDTSGFCTGFVVAPNLVATPWHCVPGPKLQDGYPTALVSSFVQDYNSKGGENAKSVYLYFDPRFGNERFGVSFLKLIDPKTKFDSDRVLDLADGSPEPGQVMAALVHEKGGPKTYVSEGCAVVEDENTPDGMIAHSCELGTGSLGGPLIDPDTGKVLAMHMYRDTKTGIGYARTAAEMGRFFPSLGKQ